MPNWSYNGLTRIRRPTRTVQIGDVAVGSRHPIRVQSMTTPSTQDTQATVEQIARLDAAGCEIVRLTVPTSRDADNLPNIRREMRRRGIDRPLVADIHFTPAAAMRAIEHVEKIRINPGNYADKKKFAVREYDDAQYATELERIAEVFSPLVKRAVELGVSMRIGANHGSLSDRVMNRYGDTPEGMVESALEFVRICENHRYRELILSMKASNPVVVLHAYRLLATRMSEQGMDYPIHLGVTEAGDGEDGRVKSAVGIGTLLEEGIGDTVRVSLTEDPVREIPVAQALVRPFNVTPTTARPTTQALPIEIRDPYGYSRRASDEVRVGPHRFGGKNQVGVEVPLRAGLADPDGVRREIDAQTGPRVAEEVRAEIVSVFIDTAMRLEALRDLHRSIEHVAPHVALSARIDLALLSGADDETVGAWLDAAHRLHVRFSGAEDLPDLRRLLDAAATRDRALLVEVETAELALSLEPQYAAGRLLLAVAPSASTNPLHTYRTLAARLAGGGLETPLVLIDRPADRAVDRLLGPSSSIGGLLCDGIGDAVQLEGDDPGAARRLAFGILQAARVRITRTEFISCPSCGRTLFDLEETTARIKERTAHLKGLKIAVMGCVVNGPGEMADADFGYVGWGEGKIALFVGKELVARDIPTVEADERLVELIKKHGCWVDPPVSAPEQA